MIRLLGSLLVTGACLWAGWSRRQWYRRRRQTLSDFCHAFARMEAELSEHETETAALLSLMATGAGRAEPFFRRCLGGMEQLEYRPFSEIWMNALTQSDLPLRQEELALLGRGGRLLGRYDGKAQALLLSQLRREMERCLEHAREEERRQGKTAVLLGLTAGLMAVMLLN